MKRKLEGKEEAPKKNDDEKDPKHPRIGIPASEKKMDEQLTSGLKKDTEAAAQSSNIVSDPEQQGMIGPKVPTSQTKNLIVTDHKQPKAEAKIIPYLNFYSFLESVRKEFCNDFQIVDEDGYLYIAESLDTLQHKAVVYVKRKPEDTMNDANWVQIMNLVAEKIEEHLKKFPYFQMTSDEILAKQKSEYKFEFTSPFPHGTNDVLDFNFLFGKIIKNETRKDIQREEVMSKYYNSLLEVKGREDIFSADILKKNVSKKVDIIVQTRGVGKTMYLMSHAVSGENGVKQPTIYIDTSRFGDGLLSTLISKIMCKVKFISDPVSRSKFAQEVFRKYFFCKIICFLGFVEVMNRRKQANPNSKLDYSDFLRISMPNNLEHKSYVGKIYKIIHQNIENFANDSIEIKIDQQMNNFQLKSPYLVIDEFGDLVNGYSDEQFADRSVTEEMALVGKQKRIYHPFIEAFLQFSDVFRLEIAGTSGNATGAVKTAFSSYKEKEIGFHQISNFEDGSKLLDVMRPFMPVECFPPEIVQEYRSLFSDTRARLVVEDVFENIFTNWDGKNLSEVLKIGEKTIKNCKKRLRRLFEDCFQKNPDLACRLFLNCLIHGFTLDNSDLAHALMDKGLVGFVGLDKDEKPIYEIEHFMYSTLKEIFSFENFKVEPKYLNTCFSLLMKDMAIIESAKGETFEIVEGFILCLLSLDKTKPLRDYPIFKGIPKEIPLEKYHCSLTLMKRGSLKNWNFKTSELLKPSDEIESGADKVFVLEPNTGFESLQPILVVIHDKNTKWKPAIQSVWPSILSLKSEKLDKVNKPRFEVKNSANEAKKADEANVWKADWVVEREPDFAAKLKEFSNIIAIVVSNQDITDGVKFWVPSKDFQVDKRHLELVNRRVWKEFLLGLGNWEQTTKEYFEELFEGC